VTLAASAEAVPVTGLEALQVILRSGDWFEMDNVLETCGCLCAATGRPAEAVTLRAATEAQLRSRHAGLPETIPWMTRQREVLRDAREVLGPDQARAAEERGAAMSLDTAVEYAPMLTAPGGHHPDAAPALGKLSAREQELFTLVACGRTDAQIVAQLFISVRTVGSHLDRIRDKTGCHRRADLTRLVLSAGLI